MSRMRQLWERARPVAAVPLGAIILSFLVASVIVVVSSIFTPTGFDPTLPFKAFAGLIEGSLGGVDKIVNTLVNAAPLILCGLAVGVGFKGGLFNIGVQGQFLLGAVFAVGVGAELADAPVFVAVPLAIAVGTLAGAFWGFIPGALKAWTGAHEVVTTIMLNFIGASIVAFLVLGPFLAPGFSFARTGDLGNAALPALPDLGLGLSRLHIGVLIAFMAVPVMSWLLNRSTIGFEIRTVGANPDAARYAGIRPRFMIILTMTLSGLLAGLAGSVELLGTSQYMIASYGTSVGFDAITVALLGRSNPVGILFSGLLLGALRAGSGAMQVEARIPVELVDVIQAVILLFLAADVIVRRVFRIRAAEGAISGVTTTTESYGRKVAG
jgi:general nucleoside transport system permease protein